MVHLDSTNTHDDSQDLQVTRFQAQRGVETGTALLDVPEVESGGARDRLHAPLGIRRGRSWLRLGGRRVRVVQRDGWFVVDLDCLTEGRTKVGVLLAPVSRIPARIHDQLLKVGQAAGLLGPGRLAAGQSSKLVEVDRLRPPRLQISVEEGRVAYLVVGVIGDVLRHVAVKVLQRSNVGLVSAVYTSELVVLLPEIGLDELRRGEKPQNRR